MPPTAASRAARADVHAADGEHAEAAGEQPRREHRRNDPGDGLAGRQLHHLRRRPLLLPQPAAHGLPRQPQLDHPQGSRRSRRAARPPPPRSSPTIEQKLQALPGELDALRTRGAEEIKAEEQRIAAAAAADRDRLLEQTRREIDLQVRLAKKEILEHAADLSVQLATDASRKKSRRPIRSGWSIAICDR